MPRPPKIEKPLAAEPDLEPVQGTTIVVLHPGSFTLQLGRATDHFPQSIPHVIATLQKDESQQAFANQCNPLIRDGIWHPESEDKRLNALNSTNQLINAMRISFGHRKPHVSQTQIASFNAKVVPDTIQGESGVCWTDVSENPPVLIGEQAQYLDPNAPYTLVYPIKNGQLNLHSGPDGSFTAVCAKLETLWSLAIQMYLDIPVKDFQYYRAVLIVPDIFNKHHLKEMANILLNHLGFSNVILHQESVCATFGSGLPSACVVDVGDQKTSICCVEDGVSIPSTRLRLNYGGSDITRCFYWLLQRINFPYKECDINDKLDAYLLQELKETFCHLSFEIPVGHVHEFQVYRPFESGLLYQLKLGDEPLQAPTFSKKFDIFFKVYKSTRRLSPFANKAFFTPQLFGFVNQKLVVANSDQHEHDPEDLLDDKYLLELQFREPSAKKGKIDTDNINESMDKTEAASSPLISLKQGDSLKNLSKLSSFEMDGISLDSAILYSIDCCGNSETKRKMYSSILVVGGGLMFKGTESFLLRKLQAQLPVNLQFMRDQLEVLTRPKDIDPRTICWKGGSVLSILDSAQELWISKPEFNMYGSRILRERCAFQWSLNVDKQ
eukprot:gene9126-10099_t